MNTYCLLFSFVLGSVVGSGVMCIAERMAEGREWCMARSRCDACDHCLSWPDLFPIVSYLFQKGRCRYCHTRISQRYLLVECMMGCIYLLITMHHGEEYIAICRDWGLCALLLCVSIIDHKTYTIPDACIVIGIAWFLQCALIQRDLKGMREGIIFACMSFLLLALVAYACEKARGRQCLGGGDLKLLFMTNLYLGYTGGIFALLIASLVALVYMLHTKRKLLPFAPFISLGCVVSLLLSDKILWYCVLFKV